jgi:hypothetical protein
MYSSRFDQEVFLKLVFFAKVAPNYLKPRNEQNTEKIMSYFVQVHFTVEKEQIEIFQNFQVEKLRFQDQVNNTEKKSKSTEKKNSKLSSEVTLKFSAQRSDLRHTVKFFIQYSMFLKKAA